MFRRLFAFALIAFSCVPGCQKDGGDNGPAPAPESQVVKTSFTTTTEDGWQIRLHRMTRPGGPAYVEPMVLAGGYLENHFVFDADEKHSLARELAAQGFDVWMYDIRGTGDSQTPAIDGDNLFKWKISIDDFILKDTPAAVDFIRQQSGSPQVTWVGHSMGAMMLYGYLQRVDPGAVKAAVTLGGIARISDEAKLRQGIASMFFQIGSGLMPFLPDDMALPLKSTLEDMLADDPLRWSLISFALDSTLAKAFWNHESMNPNMIYQFLRKALPNTSTTVLKQFFAWARDQKCVGMDGYDYTANLDKVTIPVCVIAGSADEMVAPADCRWGFERLGSVEKDYMECSKANGCSVDYGHLDLLLGIKAKEEVFKHVVDFLGPRSTKK